MFDARDEVLSAEAAPEAAPEAALAETAPEGVRRGTIPI